MAAVSGGSGDLGEMLQLKFTELLHDCTTLQEEKLDSGEHGLLSKATTLCQNCLRLIENSKGKLCNQLYFTLVGQFAKALLDQTYIVECRLVNDEFPQELYKESISKLLDKLKIPEDVARMLQSELHLEIKIGEIITTEIFECLQWRRGALMYMLCHTLYEDKERWKQEAVSFIKYCEDGVRFLLLMLSVRQPLQNDESMEIRDSDTAALLNKGIFSDTHMLALMYAGEMCYWHSKTSVRTERQDDSGLVPSGLDLTSTGRQCLVKYIETCKGPLKDKGWDYSKAEMLLAEMRT